MKRLAPIWAWWHVVPHTFRTRSEAQWKEASHRSPDPLDAVLAYV
jgi:hypothetical protein